MHGTLRLAGAPNFRDLGGQHISDGRRVARGRLFRSGSLAALTAADHDTLRAVALKTVVDLRAGTETALYPRVGVPEIGAELVAAPINPYSDSAAGARYKQILIDDPTPRGAMAALDATYRMLPDACGPALKTTVELILSGAPPLVFHCSNGRDRTGVLAMMLLHILGVSREEIVAAHVESNDRIDLQGAIDLSRNVFVQVYGREFDHETLRTMNQALAESVAITFDTVAARYGSVEGYLDACGVGAAQRAALRELLLESA